LPPGKEPMLIEAPPHASEPKRATEPRRVNLWWLALAVLVLGALLGFGAWRHHRTESVAANAAEREREAIPRVNVAPVRRAAAASELMLPGNITPITEAYLYARASGYVRRRYADIGDRVKQ